MCQHYFSKWKKYCQHACCPSLDVAGDNSKLSNCKCKLITYCFITFYRYTKIPRCACMEMVQNNNIYQYTILWARWNITYYIRLVEIRLNNIIEDLLVSIWARSEWFKKFCTTILRDAMQYLTPTGLSGLAFSNTNKIDNKTKTQIK